jgi:hypothetical protein
MTLDVGHTSEDADVGIRSAEIEVAGDTAH